MTVKIIPAEHKSHIAHLYAHENSSSDDITKLYGVSKRTIQRVLVEQGVNRARVRRTKSEEITICETPAKTETPLHIEMIELTFMEKVQCLFKAIFWRTPKQDNAQARK